MQTLMFGQGIFPDSWRNIEGLNVIWVLRPTFMMAKTPPDETSFQI
ncbi:MAG: hypothetical protein WB643_06870 [Candidatus Bathyarchaeia archaeon]